MAIEKDSLAVAVPPLPNGRPSMDLDRRMTITVQAHPVLATAKGYSVYAVFRPVLFALHYAGFLIISKAPDEILTRCDKAALLVRKLIRTGYMVLMWVWTLLMSINIFWIAIVVTAQTDPTNGRKANILITFLEESPYSLIAIRNALVLTIFVWHSEDIWNALTLCEELRIKIAQAGSDPDLLRAIGKRPNVYVVTTVLLLLSWEVYEWNVWFWTMGLKFVWEMKPFGFNLFHYQYAILWWLFITIPFVLSQLAICVPSLFALIIHRYCRYLNDELSSMGKNSGRGHVYVADLPDVTNMTGDEESELGRKVTELRRIHFEIGHSVRQLDKTVRSMLLVQFVFDLFVLFGFLGLLLQSKDESKTVLEWTFYIPSALIWMFFLLHYNMPLIGMASESEKTHALVHALTFPWTGVCHEKMADFAVFLEESRHTIIGFTGRKFYYVNRAYLVTCAAVVGSYFLVLAEILDRFYGNEEIKQELNEIQRLIQNRSPRLNSSGHSV
ncbi:hypothetical protein BV898_07685 [Hypsibius exemplaris]|uniref:Gustatory receptor n=1 Tax=Hypsibius exemplaris TaxID=2072580 RepID=A0A1W0WSX6_HYPEX|nr:hypothetical protein BV898_07685 [Hypsibius exemplaris]